MGGWGGGGMGASVCACMGECMRVCIRVCPAQATVVSTTLVLHLFSEKIPGASEIFRQGGKNKPRHNVKLSSPR